MKNIEEIQKIIDSEIENKKIDGFIENSCLYVPSPLGYSYFFMAICASWSLVIIMFGVISSYLGVDVKEFSWAIFIYIVISIIMMIKSKDYIAYDYNLGKFFLLTKLFNKNICKSYCIDVRNIVEIGINNIYEPRRNNNDIFKKPNDDEVFEYHFMSNIAYLNTEGKLKNLSAYVYDKQKDKNKILLDNLSKFCKLIANILEIPCKICEAKQKLEVVNIEGSRQKTLNIVPIDLKKEKRDRLIFNIKIYILRVSIMFVLLFSTLMVPVIMEYGLWNVIKISKDIIMKLIFETIPRELGLK